MEEIPNPSNAAFIEGLHDRYLEQPDSVEPSWQRYFKELHPNGNGAEHRVGPTFKPRSLFSHSRPRNGHAAKPAAATTAPQPGGDSHRQHLIEQLVRNYRVRGHMIAQLDPLGRPRPNPPELDLAHMGLAGADMDRPFMTDVGGPGQRLTLRQILDRLRNTYCRSIGVQFMHIDDPEVRRWLQERMESTQNQVSLNPQEQRRILRRLTEAVVFESYLQKKYVGAKTFSLEGGETLIPLLDLAIEGAAAQGVVEIVLAMSHRGRLNVLANIVGKPARDIFREFEDTDPHLYLGGGDVKHHLGYSGNWTTSDERNVHLSLCFNPSHLEFINPVALGRVRAKQDRTGDTDRRRGMALLIHGDASFAAEGIVQETLNLSELDGYRTGGTLHVVVNNQIGFTTLPGEGRSSVYCTDVAKMLQAPIFHVNGESPEAVAQVVRLALAFRHEFRRDVFIDMYCYRLQGHNEGDEPTFTQPVMYRHISERLPVREAYLNHLFELGGVTRDEADQMVHAHTEKLEAALSEARAAHPPAAHAPPAGIWEGYQAGPEDKLTEPETGVEKARLAELLQSIMRTPDGFHLHKKLERGREVRERMAKGERPLDWATGETLALASLATEGHRIRLSGQDSERGTFSHRHSTLHDAETDEIYRPLQHLAENQAPVEIVNSPLSEAAVMGFDYGYSLDCPDGLVAWEGQFGDFVNAGQVIIDQFITSAEDKWRRLSGLVLLLPHGFEGQGPEHSSGRIERFLALAAEQNIQVANPTTPAQYFHLLRRQVVRRWRKPLIVFTPKSLLRHPKAVSTLDELATGRFRRVIADAIQDNHKIDRILLCSGKIYYDLADHRDKLGRDDVAILRLEQLYPFPAEELAAALAPFADHVTATWVQEEPRNMGAWPYLCAISCHTLLGRLPFGAVTRPESASPATGSHNAHRIEQERIITRAFGGGAECP